MSKHTTLDERMKMITLAQQGLSNQRIAQQMRLSVYTVRKWRRRYRKHGEQGLYSQMGRPKRGVLSTFPPNMRETLRALRHAHPGWGPISLLAFLRQDPRWQNTRLPSRSQVASFLRTEGLVAPRKKHTQLPQTAKPDSPPAPHQEWEMDAQGVIHLSLLGQASVINIVDLATSVHVGSWVCPKTRKPRGEDYRRALRMAFSEFGLPEQISLDHDTAFLGTNAHSPFPTSFLLWLIALGVKVRFIESTAAQGTRPSGRPSRVELCSSVEREAIFLLANSSTGPGCTKSHDKLAVSGTRTWPTRQVGRPARSPP